MANVDMTLYTKPVSLDGFHRLNIQKKTGLNIPFEWHILLTGVGDGTDTGLMRGHPDLSSLGMDLYYVISTILWYTDDSSQKVRVQADSDRFDNLHFNGVADGALVLWEDVQNFSAGEHKNTLKDIIYLGRPRRADADAGQLLAAFNGHAGTSNYRIYLAGYALENPLPLSALFQQNPLN